MSIVPAVAAGITAIGSLFGGSSANKARADEARRQRRWEERMSNTAHQREVADYQKAGLNPALAYNRGGASTPSASVPNIEDTISPALSGANSAMAQAAMMQKSMADADLTQAQAAQLRLESAARLAQLKAVTAGATAKAQNLRYDASRKGATYFETVEADRARGRMALVGEKQQAQQAAFQSTQLPLLLRGMEQNLALGTAKQTLLNLSMPEAQAMADKWRSWAGKNISPWLNDASGANRILKDIIPMFRKPTPPSPRTTVKSRQNYKGGWTEWTKSNR
nr:MAG: DNA pilot protein [Microvirus sp.]